MIFNLLKRKFGKQFSYNISGLGKSFTFPSFINDRRIESFNNETEKMLCVLYAESCLVFGLHGSSMILPSAHAGMAVSLMPSRRWGNFGEDILYNENDVRLASFQRRIVPMNLCIFDLRDILSDMLSGRKIFIKKFIHSEEL